MRKLYIIAISLLFALILGLLIYPIPIFSPSVLDAGDTYGNEMIVRKFRVFNLGLRGIEIKRYEGSCICASIDGPFWLPPLCSREMSVTLQSHGITGAYRVEIAVEYASGNSQLLLILGKRIIYCRADPDLVNLSQFDVQHGNHIQENVSIIFSEPVPSNSISFEAGSERVKIGPITKLRGSLAQMLVRLDYDCSGKKGLFHDWFKVKYTLNKPSEYTVQIQGSLPGGFDVEPSIVGLSSLEISGKPKLKLSITGLEAGEKLKNIRFSKNIGTKDIPWQVNKDGFLELDLSHLGNMQLRPFSLLALTNYDHRASVYFSQ